MIFLSLLLTACGNKVSVDELKANKWIIESSNNEPNMILSFTDHIVTFKADTSSMESTATDEWESIGEELGKSIVENINYKYEYTLEKNTLTWIDSEDKNNDAVYTIEKDGKNLVLTPDKNENKKDREELFLKPYSSKKSSSNKSSAVKASSAKKTIADLNDVIEKFNSEGLEVHEPRKMTKDDYGMAPLKAKEGMIFGVQVGSDGEYQNARIFSFENVDDLNDTKKYYDDLGKESSMTFSYTAANEDKLVLMQFNGDLPKEVVDKYVDNADLTLTPVSFDTSSQDTQVDNTNSSTDTASPEQQQIQQEQATQQAPAQQEQAAQQNDTSANTGTQYGTVQAGEGPKEVAGRYGMSVDEFLDANGMDADNYYFDPGQQVVVK